MKHELQYEKTKLDFFRDLLTFASNRLKTNPKPLGRIDATTLRYKKDLPIATRRFCLKKILLKLLGVYLIFGYIFIKFILKRFANKHMVAKRKVILNVLFWPLSLFKVILQWLLKTPKF